MCMTVCYKVSNLINKLLLFMLAQIVIKTKFSKITNWKIANSKEIKGIIYTTILVTIMELYNFQV